MSDIFSLTVTSELVADRRSSYRLIHVPSIVHRSFYKINENRRSTAENTFTTESQTCGIARYATLIVLGTMFDSLYLGR